jgi:hypothetical protein
MLLVTYLERDAGFYGHFIMLPACSLQKPSSKYREVGSPVPEEMFQALLTNKKHGTIYQIHATGII